MYHENSKFKKSVFRIKIIITLFSLITATCFMAAVALNLSPKADATDGAIKLPVLMYHLVVNDPTYVSDYVITPEMFRQDMEYIKANGYNTVVVEDIINHVKYGQQLPENPIMITLDDGYYNNYLNVYPILQELSMRAVISIIGVEADRYSESDDPMSEYYSHSTWDQLREMSQSGIIELQNHSYDLHRIENGTVGVGRLQGESDADYKARITADIAKNQERFEAELGFAPMAFTYPFGSSNDISNEVLRDLGFEASLGTNGLTYYVSDNEEKLSLIPRYNRTGKMSAKDILNIA